MPTSYIKKLSEEGHGSVESLEKKWAEAKSKAAQQGKAEDYSLITHIFKQMVGASVRLEAKQRLQAERLAAMPQLVPGEHESPWFEDFYRLRRLRQLFTFNGFPVFLYQQPLLSNPSYYAALHPNTEQPLYINEVFNVRMSCLDDALRPQLARFKNLFMQSSVAFHANADRAKLKGLATKIFWDYLASNGNAAITDSQQTKSGMNFWKKLYNPGFMYLPVRVAQNYRDDYVQIVSGDSSFETASHLAYNVPKIWRESEDGRFVRLIISKL